MPGAGQPAAPKAPGTSTPTSSGSRTCPSCGWANAAAAERCEFCKVPLDRRAARPPRVRSVLCPHCGSEAPREAGDHICADCGLDARLPASTLRSLGAKTAIPVRRFHFSVGTVLFAMVVSPALVMAFVFVRGHGRAVTADRIRQVSRMLEIYQAENGGFPQTLGALEKRAGPIPEAYRKDGWDRPFDYTVGSRMPNEASGVGPLFATCALRSAGRNGIPGDADDVVWKGTTGGR